MATARGAAVRARSGVGRARRAAALAAVWRLLAARGRTVAFRVRAGAARVVVGRAGAAASASTPLAAFDALGVASGASAVLAVVHGHELFGEHLGYLGLELLRREVGSPEPPELAPDPRELPAALGGEAHRAPPPHHELVGERHRGTRRALLVRAIARFVGVTVSGLPSTSTIWSAMATVWHSTQLA